MQLKEDKSLLTRFMITARKRQELDLEYCFGNFEFSVVPKSFFTYDGQPLTCTDKSSILHKIEMLSSEFDADSLFVPPGQLPEEEEYNVVVIDGMALVNQIVKGKDVLTCLVR